jgi:hypothetical protein
MGVGPTGRDSIVRSAALYLFPCQPAMCGVRCWPEAAVRRAAAIRQKLGGIADMPEACSKRHN